MPDTLIRLLERSKKPGTCRGCAAKIVWFKTLNDKAMPMNAGATPERVETERETAREIGFYRSSESHWSTCPNAPDFVRRKR